MTTSNTGVVLSLFDYTGTSGQPWADAGYTVLNCDIQHQPERVDGNMRFVGWDATDKGDRAWAKTVRADFVSMFPPCTDLASSGARHWHAKAARDPDFQKKAMDLVLWGVEIAETIGCPWYLENPRGRVSTLWRKPDFTFDPCDYGKYLEPDEPHPLWPDYIPAQDAYTKLTCIWHGGGFVVPPKRPVDPICEQSVRKDGRITKSNTAWKKLGGKSLKTKNIRSATPRGWAKAVFESNTTKGDR